MLPPLKFCLEHPQNPLQIFQMNGRAGRFGLVKPGNLSKVAPLCLVLRAIEKIIFGQAKK